MSLRAKILIALLVVLVMTGSLLSVNTIMAKRETLQMKRLIWIHQKYSALQDLKIHVNRQLAEAQAIFIYGREFAGGFEQSTQLIKAAMEALVDGVNMENSLAQGSGGPDLSGETSQARLVRLQHKYEDINRQIVLMGRLINVGRTAKAVDHFKREVHARFTDFFAEIDGWTRLERTKLQELERFYVQLSKRHNLLSNIGLSVILLVVLLYSFTFIYLLGPRLKHLLKGTRQIAQGDFSQPINAPGSDEFSELAGAMNQMMKDLAASRKKLLEQSYYSGLADMISGTLHNLRNSLAPIVVELESIEGDLQGVRLDRFAEVAAKIGNPATSPERLAALLEYAQLTLLDLSERLPQMSGALASARKKVDLVEQVLNEQNRFSSMARPLEKVTLAELVQDSLALVKPGYLEKVRLVDESLQSVRPFSTQRIVMVQVLANLINNAMESVLRADIPADTRQVVINCAEEQGEDGGQLHIQVVDNGLGIEPEMLTKIFARGVSDKAQGYGLGLHWCANAIAALSGELYAESKGPGYGAILHLIV